MQDGEAERIAAEARELVRRAAGDTAGKTVGAQVRQAARHLGYPADHWRPRECWYGRGASPAALDDLRKRYAAWRDHEQARADELRSPADVDPTARRTLAQRLDAIRTALADLQRAIDELAAQVESADG